MVTESASLQVPYISFRTLLNLLERLEPEPPPKIDKSVLSYLSGGYATQTLAGLKALGLINDDGVPTDLLVSLVTVPAMRRQLMSDVWHSAFSAVFRAIQPEKATAGQLDDTFATAYGVTGETKRKAVSFFVHGAQYGEIPLSTLITSKVKGIGGTTSRTAGSARRNVRRRGVKVAGNQNSAVASSMAAPQPPVLIHPMLAGSIQWLYENGPNWTDTQARVWSENFVSSVRLVYPPKPTDAADDLREARATDGAA
jgi:hypothetical protein